MRNSLCLSLLCLSLMSGPVLAEDAAKPDESNLPTTLAAGDAAAGEGKAATCGACHGANGMASIPAYPHLAGQGAAYLNKQLMEFKSGARNNAVMAGMVAALQPQDMLDLAAFYAGQAPAEGVSSPTDIELGESIYRGGITSAGVPSCSGCHGPAGAGMDAAKFPRLAGQNSEYVVLALKSFRSGERANDPQGMMGRVAKRMTDQEISAVANYIQGLH